MENSLPSQVKRLKDTVSLDYAKILNPGILSQDFPSDPEQPVLIILVAGKGTRFGSEPKCIQRVHGIPLARHSIDAFRRYSPSPVISIVGYRYSEVTEALGDDNIYILTGNPSGGTAYAAFESLCVPELLEKDPLLIVTMGDRIVPSAIFRKLSGTHCDGDKEADITFLTAIYEPPRNTGKGRVLRDGNSNVLRIIEERDIHKEKNDLARNALLNLTEGNCPLYMLRASTLHKHLESLDNDNAQRQFYLTDIIEKISSAGGEIRTLTTSVTEPEYDLLTSDVTQPMDLALLEGILASNFELLVPEEREVEKAAVTIMKGRPSGQTASIARQLEELLLMVQKEKLPFQPGKPAGIGISGGRLRIAFMHPDMVRFFGPAWQMPIGAGNESGDEQIVILLQSADDGRIHLVPMNQQYRENINFVPADFNAMYPGDEVSDMNAYEKFGTKMSEGLLLSLGYFSDEEINDRRIKNQPLPPPTLWVSNNMRRPFALVGNAIASFRTLRTGNLGARVREHLGLKNFRGLRLVSAGNIPQGGFSSSSAVTVATKNAINSLFEIGISPDLLVHLACQAEYGTGVRAGSLDQATEQKGLTGQGTLISSNPKDNYRILGTYPIPYERFQIIFPYSVERDRNAWRWSCGTYAESSGKGSPTTTEMRKLTGKAAEIAAVIVQLPLATDFFKIIEEDLLTDGLLSYENKKWICSVLLKLPLIIEKHDLYAIVKNNQSWLAGQVIGLHNLTPGEGSERADLIIKSLFEGWNDPILRRTEISGRIIEEKGIPLRAMIAYLFGEVAKNFYLINNPDKWIEYVTLSQKGDTSFEINPENLPEKSELMRIYDWERNIEGPDLLNLWLEKVKAVPFDYNRGLDDDSLSGKTPPDFHRLEGTGFFRGLALIDFAEAMLKRAFGTDSAAVRVNAAGQGDYFQVHIDTRKTNPAQVKQFISKAFYKRFGLRPDPEFVEVNSGGGATGVRLGRFDSIPHLIQKLRSNAL